MVAKPNTATTDQAPRYTCGGHVIKANTILPRSCVAGEGVVPRLIRSGRWHLPVWLFLIATATPDKATVSLRSYSSFATGCLGLADTEHRNSLRSKVTRIFARLEDMELIAVDEKRHGRMVLQMRALDGSGGPYSMPRRRETKVVYVPTGPLFSNRWHQKLTAVEIGGLLIALTEETWQYRKFEPHQWEKSREAIARDYGIAASTWSKAKEGLLSAGLLEWDIPRLRSGSQPERVPIDRYTVHPETLNLDAITAPQFVNLSDPQTITAPGTGAKLRLHRQVRIKVPPPSPKVVRMRRRDA
jgi:hypothetical protein